LLVAPVDDVYQGQALVRVLVAPLKAGAPVPPGIPRLPGPGQAFLSPALAVLLAAAPPDQLADRFGTVVGTIGDQNITFANSLTFYGQVFTILIGSTAADILVVMLCAGIVLSMNTATMDGSRALYGISQDGMTIRWLGKLNRNNVPGNAMTMDALLNIVLLFVAIGALAGGGYLKILAVSNFGYVIAHIFAISGFLLLRRDRPGWPRPIKLSPIWTGAAVLCLVLDIVYLVVGSISFSLTGYPGGSQVFVAGLVVLVIAVLLYIYRVVVEDKAKLRWSLPAPTMPDEQPASTS